jgi:hypothetical protein
MFATQAECWQTLVLVYYYCRQVSLAKIYLGIGTTGHINYDSWARA